MLATIAKEWTFHAAHRLPNHDGPCRDLHGHSYRMQVAVTGRVKKQNGDPDEGMVLDFGVLKDIYEKEIEPLVEHKYLNDTLENRVPLTSSENLAWWIHSVFAEELKGRGDDYGLSVAVRLWETPTSWAEAGETPWRK